MQVRAFLPQDEAAVAALGLACATQVLEKDGCLIGAAHIEQGWWHAFCIAPAWRQKGYGTYFCKQCLKDTLHDSVCVWLTHENAAGKALCAKMGFVPEATPESDCSQALLLYVRRSVPRLDALAVVHGFLRQRVHSGAVAIDATAGNGHDTVLLAQLVGATGRVTALDIQPQAVQNTNDRLRRHGFDTFAKALCDSHANLAQYGTPESVDAIVFNLGYLPGGSHAVFTQPHTSVPAMHTALSLLRHGGVLTACLYAGSAQGTAERSAALAFFRGLSPAHYTVMVAEFVGRPETAPVPVCVLKL